MSNSLFQQYVAQQYIYTDYKKVRINPWISSRSIFKSMYFNWTHRHEYIKNVCGGQIVLAAYL